MIEKIAPVVVKNADKLANEARNIASSNNLSMIAGAIKVSPANMGSNFIEIFIIADDEDATENTASKSPGVTWAYEYGSGLFSRTGPRKYPITPKNASVLKFPFQESLNISQQDFPNVPRIVLDDEGNVYLPSVMHPGVQARPYMKPASDKIIPQLEKELLEAADKAIIFELEAGFVE